MSSPAGGLGMAAADALSWIQRHSPVEVTCGAGTCAVAGAAARLRGARHAFLVTDRGVRKAGHADRVLVSLQDAGVRATLFDGVAENPHTGHVAAGVTAAREASRNAPAIDWIVAVGGGSAMDCAKGVNLLLTNDGEIRDYWGIDKPTRALLPSILIPTTAGTGSEAQSFALISDERTHVKMACGDRRLPRAGGLRPVLALLDSDLTATVPRGVAAAVGIDALTHAVETAGSTAATDTSRETSRRAWELLQSGFETSLRDPANTPARTQMLLGAHLAGLAIEQAMLGAAHACANPLTAKFGITHGVAVGLLLPHVIRFNAASGPNPYAALGESEMLALEIARSQSIAGLPARLRDLDVAEQRLPELAAQAAEQWTARFNPRPVGAADLLEIYRAAR